VNLYFETSFSLVLRTDGRMLMRVVTCEQYCCTYREPKQIERTTVMCQKISCKEHAGQLQMTGGVKNRAGGRTGQSTWPRRAVEEPGPHLRACSVGAATCVLVRGVETRARLVGSIVINSGVVYIYIFNYHYITYLCMQILRESRLC
jgi:hypothetical protein